MRQVRHVLGLMAFCAGLGSSPGAQAEQIVIGQVAPLVGLEATQGRAYSLGIQLYLNRVNKAGGVNGNTFALVRSDDKGQAEATLAATRQLLDQNRPLVLAGYFGNRNISNLLDSGLLEKEKIALVGYRNTEASPEGAWIYSVRASLKDEIQKIVAHLSTVGIQRLGLLYEEGPSAAGLQAATEEAMKRNGAQLVSKASYPEGTVRVTAAVDKFLSDKPQAIILVTSGAAAGAFIEGYRGAGGAAQLFAHSGTDVEQMSKRLSETQMQGLAISQVTPNPYKITMPLSREFNEAFAAHPDPEVPVSYAMMEGYIAAKVIVEAVRRAGPRVNRESFAKALGSLDTVDLGGYPVGFPGGSRAGSKFVDLSIVSSTGRIRQ